MPGNVITFFMLVTDRDCVIADYAVRSYARIKGLAFKLVVYSNWVRSDLRQRYFPRWRPFPFVEIREDPSQTDDRKPDDRTLEGPFEPCAAVWDRELRKLTDTPLHAVVDADFEILDPSFLSVMLERLAAERDLIALSTDYTPTLPRFRDSFTGEYMELRERWHTHCCIYKREALGCSQSYVSRIDRLSGRYQIVWDDHAFFQEVLRTQCGYRLAALDRTYQPCFIHYGGFAQNRHISERNVAAYRRIQLLRHRGLFGLGDPVSRRLASMADRVLFRHVDRRTYVPGWGQSG